MEERRLPVNGSPIALINALSYTEIASFLKWRCIENDLVKIRRRKEFHPNTSTLSSYDAQTI